MIESLKKDEISKPYITHYDLSSNYGTGRLYIIMVMILLGPGLKLTEEKRDERSEEELRRKR